VNGIDDGVDGLSRWVHRRERRNHVLVTVWCAVISATGVLVLLSDGAVYAPVLPLLAGLGWIVWTLAVTRVWRVRSARAAHPVVRAQMVWTAASGRALPPGWQEPTVTGDLHRTADGWRWRPSWWAPSALPSRRWADADVRAATLTPVWACPPASQAQLRLYLRDGRTVEILVSDVERFTMVPTVGSTR
jgi:hypothetical protein